MAGNRSALLSESELRELRALLYATRSKSIDTLQRQVSQIGIRLADLLVKVAAGLEAGLQETRGHLKVAVETMMEQAEELEQIKAWIEAACLTPASLASSPRGGKDAAEVARVAEKLSETETRLAALESEVADVSHQLRTARDRVETPDRPAGDEALLERLEEHISLLALAGARRVARDRQARIRALERVAEAVEQRFIPRAIASRRQLSGDVTSYDGCRALEERAREACEELRREARRLGEVAATEAMRLSAAPDSGSERWESVRELLALGGVPDGEDDLDFEIRRVLSEWFLPLIDLTVSYRETGAPEGEAAFQALLCDLMEAGWQADLEAIVPARGAAFDPVIHEAVGPAPTGDARVARVESPGYRIGGGIMRLARVHLEQ